MVIMSSTLLLALGVLAIFVHPIAGLSCYIGNDSKTVFSDDEWKYCVMKKDVESKIITYTGSNDDKDLSRGACLIEYDFDNNILNVNCYCVKNKCNVPGTMDPKY